MDHEIDLRPYVVAILRRWRLVLTCMVVLMIIGTGSTIALRPAQSASANVLIVPISSQVTLDTRFQTTNGNQASTPAAQRQALIGLASSQAVAKQVIAQVGSGSTSGNVDPVENLIRHVDVSASSDLLQITVNDPDPARALKLADAWGQAYESLVADVYTRSPYGTKLLGSEITAAQQRYDSAQQALEGFLSDGKVIKTQNQITQLNGLLSGSRQEQQLLYTDYLSRTRQIQLVLEDAQTLHNQAKALSTSGFADRFATLLLLVRTVDSSAPTFQLSTGDLTSGQASDNTTLADLEQLISVLTSRRDELREQSSSIAEAIANNSDPSTGLDPTSRQAYMDQLAALNSAFEQLRARQDLLTQERDLARDTLLLLQRKRDEQQVARSSPQMEVHFVSASLDPKPGLGMRAALTGMIAGIVGLVLGSILALLLGIVIPAVRQLSLPAAVQGAARADTAKDRPVPGD